MTGLPQNKYNKMQKLYKQKKDRLIKFRGSYAWDNKGITTISQTKSIPFPKRRTHYKLPFYTLHSADTYMNKSMSIQENNTILGT